MTVYAREVMIRVQIEHAPQVHERAQQNSEILVRGPAMAGVSVGVRVSARVSALSALQCFFVLNTHSCFVSEEKVSLLSRLGNIYTRMKLSELYLVELTTSAGLSGRKQTSLLSLLCMR